MARVNNPLIGSARGSVGGSTFSRWKGLNILKEKITTMTNPRTALQMANRSRFVALLGFAKLYRPILQIGFKEYANVVSWMNRFISVNSSNGFQEWSEIENAWVTNFQNMTIAEGSLYPTEFVVSSSTTASVILNWDAVPINNQASNDLVFGLIVTPTETKFQFGSVTRQDGSCTFPLAGTVGDEVWVYLFFASNDMRIVSNSLDATATLVAP